MSDTASEEPPQHEPQGGGDPHSYLRLPWYAVTAVLVLVLGIALAVGLYASRASRPSAVAAPTQPPITATPPAAAAATAAPTPVAIASTPTPQVAVATSAPTPPPTAVAAATPTSVVGAPPAPTSTQAAPSESPTALPTVEPTLAAEVGAAYESFWRIRSQALLELDDSHLADVMDGDYLQNIESLIDQLRAENHAIKTQVTLNYRVVEASLDAASVIDSIDDNSVYVAIGTEDSLGPSTTDHVQILYRLRRLEDRWKVIDSVRSQ